MDRIAAAGSKLRYCGTGRRSKEFSCMLPSTPFKHAAKNLAGSSAHFFSNRDQVTLAEFQKMSNHAGVEPSGTAKHLSFCTEFARML
ncbi:MAG: hypothetical protein QUV71_04855 [Rhizobium sp.]|nr:hypothetical protein [Rhizobium sp.]MDM8013929.1 hypothetical protein [Rhizobium sp.]